MILRCDAAFLVHLVFDKRPSRNFGGFKIYGLDICEDKC
jgi:hypothetical protein